MLNRIMKQQVSLLNMIHTNLYNTNLYGYSILYIHFSKYNLQRTNLNFLLQEPLKQLQIQEKIHLRNSWTFETQIEAYNKS